MTRMNRISSVMPQLIAFLSAPVGYPCAFSVSRIFFSSKPESSVSPIFVVTADPAGRSLDLNDRPYFVSASLVLSHSENFDHGPTKMWKSHCAGSAATEIGVLDWNAS